MSGNPIGEGLKKILSWAIPSRKYIYSFSEGSAEEYGKFKSVALPNKLN